MKRLGLVLGAVVLTGAGLFLQRPPEPPIAPPPTVINFMPGFVAPRAIDHLAAGGEVTVRGSLRASFDGAVFDATTRTIQLSQGPTVAPGGLFELERAGLRVLSQDPVTHTVRLGATGADAPACRAAGLAGPCLLPRTKDLAFERLQTESEFVSTLTGQITADVPMAYNAPVAAPTPPYPVYACFGVAGALGALALLLTVKKRRETLIARVRSAADRARGATRGDASFGEIHKKIDDLVSRAEDLDASREACEARLAKLDRAALTRKREELLASTDKGSAETLAWVSREIAEADKVGDDAKAAVHGIERVLSALGVVALEAREHRGVKVRVDSEDPVDAVAEELALREAAIEEADQAVPKARPPESSA